MLKRYLIILVARCCWMLLCYTQCRVQKLHATIHSSVSAHTLQASSCLPPSQIAGLTNFGMLWVGQLCGNSTNTDLVFLPLSSTVLEVTQGKLQGLTYLCLS